MMRMVDLQELQRQRPKARLSDTSLNGHEKNYAYVAIRRVHVSDMDGHEYKSLVSYKRHVGSAYTLLRGYSLAGVSRHSVNKIIRKERCYSFDVDDMKTSPELHRKNKCQIRRAISFNQERVR